MLEAAFDYLEANQVLVDVPELERCFRHPSKGGWPFSDRAHGWPISDCTAEGLKACLAIEAVTGCGVCFHCVRGHYNVCQDWHHLGLTIAGALAELAVVPAASLVSLPDTPPDLKVLRGEFRDNDQDLELTAWIDTKHGHLPRRIEVLEKAK
jgi:hypothetical protein